MIELQAPGNGTIFNNVRSESPLPRYYSGTESNSTMTMMFFQTGYPSNMLITMGSMYPVDQKTISTIRVYTNASFVEEYHVEIEGKRLWLLGKIEVDN